MGEDSKVTDDEADKKAPKGVCDGGVPLESLVTAGALSLEAKVRHVSDASLTNLQLFKSYLTAVSSKGYFEGAGEEGGEEWEIRMEKIKDKFRRKMWDKRISEGNEGEKDPRQRVQQPSERSELPNAAI